MKPISRGQHGGLRYGGLRRQARAALAAASSEDRAASTGAHAGAEAMRARPTTIIGLERALRHDVLLLKSGNSGIPEPTFLGPYEGTDPCGEGQIRPSEHPLARLTRESEATRRGSPQMSPSRS
jgi:hypothetical protein